MKIALKYKILLVALMSFSSCKDSFVDLDNPATLSKLVYPSSVVQLDELLTGVYATQHATGIFGHNILGKGLYLWDHTADMSWVANQSWVQMAQNNTQPNAPFLLQTWNELWRGVQRSNTLLEAVETYREKATADQLPAIDKIRGQGLFLRAFYYYYLVSLWGESLDVNGADGDKLGVPIVTKTAASLGDTQVERGTVRQGWELIVSDLIEAEKLLAGVNWTAATEKHKASGWAVKGFLAKVYVFLKEWDKAEVLLEDVIANSGKSLVPFDIYTTMFNGKNEFNSESLFEISLNVDVTSRGGTDQNMGSSLGMVFSPTYVGPDGRQAASSWSNVFPHHKNVSRYGFNLGHYFRPGVPAANASNVDPAYVTRSKEARRLKTVDPRLWVSLQQPYVDTMLVAGAKRAISHFLDINELDMEAWSFRKYVNLEGTENEIGNSNGSNILWLRLADIYLLYAETLQQKGNVATALEYINKVKRRAYDLPVNTPSVVDYKSLTDVTMAGDASLKNDPLKYERWAELFGEGNWWFDVCRWKIGGTENVYYQRVRGGEIQLDSWDYAQPIPVNELTSNVNMKQNPGY